MKSWLHLAGKGIPKFAHIDTWLPNGLRSLLMGERGQCSAFAESSSLWRVEPRKPGSSKPLFNWHRPRMWRIEIKRIQVADPVELRFQAIEERNREPSSWSLKSYGRTFFIIAIPPTAGFTGKCGIWRKTTGRRISRWVRIRESVGAARTHPVDTMLGGSYGLIPPWPFESLPIAIAG